MTLQSTLFKTKIYIIGVFFSSFYSESMAVKNSLLIKAVFVEVVFMAIVLMVKGTERELDQILVQFCLCFSYTSGLEKQRRCPFIHLQLHKTASSKGATAAANSWLVFVGVVSSGLLTLILSFFKDLLATPATLCFIMYFGLLVGEARYCKKNWQTHPKNCLKWWIFQAKCRSWGCYTLVEKQVARVLCAEVDIAVAWNLKCAKPPRCFRPGWWSNNDVLEKFINGCFWFPWKVVGSI